MAAVDRVVDIAEDIVAVRRRQRHALLRLGIPILGVALVIAAIIGIADIEGRDLRQFLEHADGEPFGNVAALSRR